MRRSGFRLERPATIYSTLDFKPSITDLFSPFRSPRGNLYRVRFAFPALEPENRLHNLTSLRTDSEKTVTVQRVDDLSQHNEDNRPAAEEIPRAQSDSYGAESSMNAEHRIKQLEEKSTFCGSLAPLRYLVDRILS